MSAAIDLVCSACRHRNRPHRGYCGGCGVSLQPVCRGCRFINDLTDQFCGGCGNMLVSHGVRVPTPALSIVPAGSAAPSADELNHLFSPVASESPDDHLPSAGITQADLDRLFGVAK